MKCEGVGVREGRGRVARNPPGVKSKSRISRFERDDVLRENQGLG